MRKEIQLHKKREATWAQHKFITGGKKRCTTRCVTRSNRRRCSTSDRGRTRCCKRASSPPRLLIGSGWRPAALALLDVQEHHFLTLIGTTQFCRSCWFGRCTRQPGEASSLPTSSSVSVRECLEESLTILAASASRWTPILSPILVLLCEADIWLCPRHVLGQTELLLDPSVRTGCRDGASHTALRDIDEKPPDVVDEAMTPHPMTIRVTMCGVPRSPSSL